MPTSSDAVALPLRLRVLPTSASADPQVSIVIVNYNSGVYLARCLASLPDGCRGIAWDAVIVDNGSTDGSESAAEEQTRRVRLIRAGTNLGFARGANVGVRQTSSPHLLVLNPDCWLSPGSIAPLVSELEHHNECHVVAPLVVDDDGTPQGNARGDPTMLTGLFGRTSLVRRLFPRLPGVVRNVVPAEDGPSREVDWVSGACCLIRRDAFERVAGFDERYFLYLGGRRSVSPHPSGGRHDPVPPRCSGSGRPHSRTQQRKRQRARGPRLS